MNIKDIKIGSWYELLSRDKSVGLAVCYTTKINENRIYFTMYSKDSRFPKVRGLNCGQTYFKNHYRPVPYLKAKLLYNI